MSWPEDFADSYMYRNSKVLDENANGHTWKRDEYGGYPDGYVGVDVFAVEGGYHNGPECETCGYGFCMHCTSVETIPKCTVPATPELLEALRLVAEAKAGLR
jgi:hypothetical protein